MSKKLKQKEFDNVVRSLECSDCELHTEIVIQDHKAHCPINGRTDVWTITIEYYSAKNKVIELVSFESWLNELRQQSLTQEETVSIIYDTLIECLDTSSLKVQCLASSGSGMTTTISKGYNE